MASEAQVEANRANSRKSTGPKTAEGKATVSQNAVKHGLLAEQVVIKDEDPGEFEFYRQSLLAELCPVGDCETILAERASIGSRDSTRWGAGGYRFPPVSPSTQCVVCSGVREQ